MGGNLKVRNPVKKGKQGKKSKKGSRSFGDQFGT